MFTDIQIDIKYRSNTNSIPEDFLIPMLFNATYYKRAVGYFSTSALLKLSIGLAQMAKHGGKIDVVCSPSLSDEDIRAINLGYKKRENTIIEALDISLTNPINEFEEERLNLVATLVAQGILTFKIAFMECDTGFNIYHEKIALAYDGNGNRISFTGSMNESKNGFDDNFESIVVFCDWKSDDQKRYIEEAEKDFEMLWADITDKVRVIDFPQIILDKLLTFKKETVDYLIDEKQFGIVLDTMLKKTFIHIPDGKKLLDYQIEAIRKWKEQGYVGIYDMATGTGKTYTALGSMEYLARELDNQLAIFILCPYVHLVGQWEEDILEWGVVPIVVHSQTSDKNPEERLMKAYKRFRSVGKPFICITTNDTYMGNKIQPIIENVKKNMNVMLVVDEAHNVGANRISHFLNEDIKYRIALSATIERYGDKKGTKIIFDYFKKRCIEYSLDRAIKEGKSLCNYEYHVIYSFLSDEERSRYNQITQELKKYIIYKNGTSELSEAGKVKLFERRRVLIGAKDKIGLLEQAMEPYKNDKYILVYCGAVSVTNEDIDCSEKQIMQVNKMIEEKLGMDVHKFTAEENAAQRITIKDCFAKGMYQVLTAIKCLDEGVNIPSIRTAFILASSQNPKEFIQRRGRLLRKAEGKDKAVIYDFVTLPRHFGAIHCGDFELDRSIVVGEMLRVKEFAEASLNRAEGLNVIDEIQEAYGISVDLEVEAERIREDFDE